MKISRFFRVCAGLLALVALTGVTTLAESAATQRETHKASPAKSTAGTGHIHTTATPEIRVTAKVDDAKRTTLYGHVSGALRAAKDLGRVDPATPAEHMVLVLRSSDTQKAELRRVLDEQQDKKTANYHQWITPDEFGSYFGVHDSDIAQVSKWLRSHGLTVEDVSKSKRIIHFSGTTGNLEAAFRTEIHRFQVGKETHVSNNSEISVPEALSSVIAGVPMNDFFRKSYMTPVKKVAGYKVGPKVYGGGCTSSLESSCNEYVGPLDFATIYNTDPLLQSGINGAGTSIAVVGRSDILLSDVQNYRQMFQLPPNDPIFVHAGQDNGVEPGDDGESDLDVEISGGIAPEAQVYFVIGTPTFLVDGITNSIEYIVDNNTADIMSISYGECESAEGAGGNAFNDQAFEQAAAQGISVFVAAGDGGPAQCDDQGSETAEIYGYAAPAEASAPYAVAVGGTAFYEQGANGGTADTYDSLYWNYGSESIYLNDAISYIPEIPWNGAKASDLTDDPSADLEDLWSGSSAISAYYVQPSFQWGPNNNVPTTDPVLAGGDWAVSITITNAGSGYTTAPTLTFAGGGCITEPKGTATVSGGVVTGATITYGSQGFGCTSAPTVTFAAPTGTGTKVTATGTVNIGQMQNILPLIAGVPHRYTPDVSLNAEVDHDGTVFCSEGGCENPTPGNYYFDIVGGTSVAAPSMAGLQALINQANGGRQGMPAYVYYALANSQAVSQPGACNSNTLPGSSSTCAFQDVTQGDNLICGARTCTSAVDKIGFQAGTGYDIVTGLGTVNAANLASQWGNVQFNSTSTTLSLSQETGISHGEPITFSGSVAAGSGTGTPTGAVAFILSSGGFGTTVNPSTGAFNGPGGFATLDSNGNYTVSLANLPAGTYQVQARYAGDTNFASSLSAPITVTVANENSTLTITPGLINGTACTLTPTNSFAYGSNFEVEGSVAGVSGQGVPTGTVTYTLDGNTFATETLDSNGNSYLLGGALTSSSCLYDYMFANVPAIPAGVHSIGASYSGDGTFNPITATPVSVTVSQLSITPTLTASPTFINFASGMPVVNLTASFSLSAITTGNLPAPAAPTGTVSFYEGGLNGTLLGTAPVTSTVVYSQPPTSSSYPSYVTSAYAYLSTSSLTPATGSVTAVYSGDNNYASTTSAATTITATSGATTTTTLTSSANPTTLNGTPTFTATIGVTSGTAPTSGTVAFYDGHFLLGTGTVGTAHTATYKVSATSTTHPLTAGAHSITAVYGGIAADATSTSNTLVETVNQAPLSITLTTKVAGTADQNSFALSAVLNCGGATPSSPTCTYYSSYGEYFFGQVFPPTLANVNFYDNGTLIASAPATTVTLDQGGYGNFTAQAIVTLAGGNHSITASYADTNYAAATSNTQTVFVAGKQTLTWAIPASITYGTALSATQLDAVDSVPGYYVYSPAAGTVLTAGAHTLSVTFIPADGIDFATQTKTVKIQVIHDVPTLTWATPAGITYGTALSGTQLDASATYNSAAVQGTYTYNPPAGTYLSNGSHTLSVTFTPNDSLDYAAVTQTTSIQVGQAPLTVTVNPASFTYGGTYPTLTGTVSGLQGNDTLGNQITVTYSSTGTATSGYGTYPITATVGGSSLSNYTLTNVPNTLTITQAPLTISEIPALGTYGSPLPTLSGIVNGVVNGDTVGGSLIITYGATASSTAPYSDAGNYQTSATVTGPSVGNYTITDNGGSLTIVPANLTITINNATAVYGSPLPTFTSTLGGLVNGDTSTDAKHGVRRLATKRPHQNGGSPDDLTIIYATTANSASPYSGVGSYPITATLSGAGATNYNVVSNTNGTLSITPATLTVVEANPSGTYGSPLPTLTGTVTGAVNGDSVGTTLAVTYSTTASSTSPYSDAGGYPISASMSGTSASNYTLSDAGGTLTINPAPLTITVNNATEVYGNALPTFTSTLGGLVNGDTSTDVARNHERVSRLVVRRPRQNGGSALDLSVIYSTTANSTAPYSGVGNYPITATLSGAAAADYTVITNTQGSLSITQAAASVTPNPASKIYGQTDPVLTGTLTGFLASDNVTATYSRAAGQGVGTYQISATLSPTGVLANYNITYNTAIFTINPTVASQITSPTPGSNLTGPTATFTWTAGAGVTANSLWIGTTGAGSNNIYDSGQTTATSAVVTKLPTLGGLVYVRLFSLINGVAQYNDYTYTASTQAQLTSPSANSTLTSPTQTFTWSAANGATSYSFWLGTTAGSSNIYTSGTTTATSATVAGLPLNGSTIYVQINTAYGSTVVHSNFTLTAATIAPAAITSPAASSTLTGPQVTFTWSPSSYATGYMLQLGSTPGAANIYSSGTTTATSITVTVLPTNGSAVYATLTTNYNGEKATQSYTYTATTLASLTSPSNGIQFTGSTQTFTWSSATGAVGYSLYIGSTGVGSSNIYSSGQTTATSKTVTTLPTGVPETIYVQLNTIYNGVAVHTNYTFTSE